MIGKNKSELHAGLIGFAVLAVVSLIIFLIYVLNDYFGGIKIQTSSSAAYAVYSLVALLVYAAVGILSAQKGRPLRLKLWEHALNGASAGMIASVLGTLFDMLMRVAARLLVAWMGLIPETGLTGMELIKSLVSGTISITWERGIGLFIASLLIGSVSAWLSAKSAKGRV